MSHSIHFEVVAPRSRFYQGPFGRLFPDLPPWSPKGVPPDKLEEHFMLVAEKLMTEPPGAPSEDSGIPAGYTYFGQFIDHDITLDITPLSDSEIDPNKLHNFRTPRLDLDCLYGRGPADQPYLYEHDDKGQFTGRLITGTVLKNPVPDLVLHDLQRNSQGRALIGDKRNDENAIVTQLHLAFALAHNTLVERAKAADASLTAAAAFEIARKSLTWLYQWIVWTDFVKRIADPAIHTAALKRESLAGGRSHWKPGMEDIYAWKEHPFIPVEFSVAAYRFGHTMPLNGYQTNFSTALGAGVGVFFRLFGGPDEGNLRGFQPLRPHRVVQWDWYLDMNSPRGFPQMARTLDTKLAQALSRMHENPVAGSIDNVLAARNLVRGVRMKLPSGPDVARRLCLDPIPLGPDEPEALWYYILKEAETTGGGKRLGPLGSTIVCATFAGLLKGDPLSWLNMEPCWTPDSDPLLEEDDRQDDKAWTLAAVIRLSGLPVSGGDLNVPGPQAAAMAARSPAQGRRTGKHKGR